MSLKPGLYASKNYLSDNDYLTSDSEQTGLVLDGPCRVNTP